MASNSQVYILEKSLEELRRMYDEVCSVYARLKTVNLTFIGGSLAFLSYLYSGTPSNNPLFIPEELYGKIFYVLGSIFYGIGFALLVIAMVPRTWETPTERKTLGTKKFKNDQDFLEYTRNRYIESLDINLKYYEKKQVYQNLATLLLFVGAIVLLVFKVFGKENS